MVTVGGPSAVTTRGVSSLSSRVSGPDAAGAGTGPVGHRVGR